VKKAGNHRRRTYVTTVSGASGDGRATSVTPSAYFAVNLLSDRSDPWAKPGRREDVMNNSSMLTADRLTHLKIVVLALVAATMVAVIGIAPRLNDGDAANSRLEATVIKAGKSVTAQGSERTAIR